MCLLTQHKTEEGGPDVALGCPVEFDSVLCWPFTPPGSTAVLPCRAEIQGIKYDTTQNATRFCQLNGTWLNYTDYSACEHVAASAEDGGIEITSIIYYAGYSVSLVALIIAVWIFLHFKELRCLRNRIHTNLMITYILSALMWIITLTLLLSMSSSSCVFLVILLHYFHLTNFFWMLVEGLYLYLLVVQTFSGDNIKLRVYLIIGWATPAIFIAIWAIVKGVFPDDDTNISFNESNETIHCLWMREHAHDWIYKAPAVGVLCINLIFLARIMWVLITKLRSANTLETQQNQKATKALLVLIPLLGITYVIVLMGPSEGIMKDIFERIRAILLSTQGFTVALLYCFLNSEVQYTMRHHIDRWKMSRSLGSRTDNNSKEWFARSRTGSTRVHSQPHIYYKRDTSESEATTTTLVGYSTDRRRASRKISSTVAPFIQPEIAEIVSECNTPDLPDKQNNSNLISYEYIS